MFTIETGLIWFCAVGVAVVAGPFGTLDWLDTINRAAFWVVIVSVSILVGYGARALVFSLVRTDRRLWQEALVTVFLVALLSPAIWWITRAFASQTGAQAPGLAYVAFYVLVLSLSVAVVRHLIPSLDTRAQRFMGSEIGGLGGSLDRSAPRLARRLDPDMTSPVLRLSAQDHHVEVATADGVQMLRMRLADAIDEMEPVEGYCTHRSHWVTRAAIAGIDRENAQKTWIVLTNGDRVPVSRTYRRDLEEAGIL
ncbi:LytTR family DNA-binding domain-containing protein [Roseovarius aestuariivivens]|uniref:LytTR family DNA-binding domain-containing protein n=1 Tax=Roseovarius aestuariivivens TaxID=1888910 RepID=UPI00107FE1DE|nr:LytTR family DNA-binding domain-containing protein [Roseovarius aestuariivivens]